MNLFELFVKIGAKDEASGTISKITSGLGKGLVTAAKVGTAAVTAVTAAAGAMSAAFIKGTSNVAQYGDNIDKMSQKMGLSAEAYQEWDFIMQHSGTSMETLKAGMKTLANAVDSGNDAFKRLGITQEEIAAMNQEELFAKTIEQLQKVDNETERTYLAGQLLGRGATELGALLNTSAEDTEAMRKQVHELGGVMSNEAVKAAAAYQDSLQNMQTAFSGIQRGMLSEFLPSMVTVMDGLSSIFSGNDSGIAKITEGVNNFADKLMEAVPKIFEVGEGILSSLATAILDNLPTLTSTATSVIIKLVDGIVSALPVLAESAIEIIGSLTQGLSDNLPTIIESAVELISTLADGILDMLPQIVQLGLDLIVSLATGISESLPELIPTIIDVVLQIVDTLTNPETLLNLVDACVAIILALADGLIDALPKLIEAVPVIIGNLVQAIIEAVPQLIFAAGELVFGLIAGLNNPDNTTALLEGTIEMLGSIIKGIASYYKQMFEKGKEIFTNIKDGFMEFIDDPKKWGKDLIDNFIDGITEKWESLKKKVSDVAQSVKDFLGFSEPKKGPLSNFHTYAPDMMELFAKGITDNENIIKSAFEKSLNFGTSSIDFASSGLGVSSSGVINGVASSNEYNSVGGNMTINLMFPDGTRIASYLLPNLIDVAKAGGTPIVNPS